MFVLLVKLWVFITVLIKILVKTFKWKKFDSKNSFIKRARKNKIFLDEKKTSLLLQTQVLENRSLYKIIEEHLNQNKQAILLMPEISLTPQMEKKTWKKFLAQVLLFGIQKYKKKKKMKF